ncbi:MAG: TonB-dependent receptor [Flavobacteriales bacterium]|nr:TonB-dependent receptor [Flavobacteriales bacterium]
MRNTISSILLSAILMLTTSAAMAQELTQTVKGRIIDMQTQAPIPFANVFILDSDPPKGATTDIDGYFKITEIPIGRISIRASFTGYETITYSNIELTSSKEIVLSFQMEESAVKIDEVVITAKSKKDETNNKMSIVSARVFSVEESKRYAGTNNDVSRMAMNYAGVRAANDATNDIVIRGNSPNGLLWRMEGVDIPNPNHFGDGGATGGPVGMLNNNVLANSDFLTAAFSAEYGNALSGVFDLKLRNGNDEKHEFLGQVGFNGFELGAEGPISKKKRSTYLINYRYSTLGVLQAMGVDFGTGTATPFYQDVTFKLNFPSKKFGTISIFGLGGVNDIAFLDSEKDPEEEKEADFYSGSYENDIINRNGLGVIGVNHTYLLGKKAYSKITLAASTAWNKTSVDSLSTDNRENIAWYRQNNSRTKYTVSGFVNKKYNARNTVRAGVFAHMMGFDIQDSVYRSSIDQFRTLTAYNGSTFLIQPYMQWQHKLNEKITFNTGVHYEHLTLNNSASVEPRLAFKWAFSKKQSLTVGYGLHSQMAPVNFYHREVLQDDGTYVKPNEDLGFTKSQHFVIGYNHSFGKNMRLKAETYYQLISNAIVSAESSSYSMLNRGTFSVGVPDYGTNDGTGYNYGVELTLEKFLDKGFYFLTTTSLFESKYKGSDGIERGTAFDGGYVFNLLAGKEFELGKKNAAEKKKNSKYKKKVLLIDVKFNIAGGQRYVPIDLERSIATGTTQFDRENAFRDQLDDYMRFDLRIGYKLIGKKTTQEWAFDIQNVTDRQNPIAKAYDASTQEETTTYQLGLFPMMLYRITF